MLEINKSEGPSAAEDALLVRSADGETHKARQVALGGFMGHLNIPVCRGRLDLLQQQYIFFELQ